MRVFGVFYYIVRPYSTATAKQSHSTIISLPWMSQLKGTVHPKSKYIFLLYLKELMVNLLSSAIHVLTQQLEINSHNSYQISQILYSNIYIYVDLDLQYPDMLSLLLLNNGLFNSLMGEFYWCPLSFQEPQCSHMCNLKGFRFAIETKCV